MVDSLAIIMSYCPTASNKRNGIIVLLKTPTKYQEFSPTLFVKTTDFQLVYNFEQIKVNCGRYAVANECILREVQLLENMLIEDIKLWGVEEAAPLTIVLKNDSHRTY